MEIDQKLKVLSNMIADTDFSKIDFGFIDFENTDEYIKIKKKQIYLDFNCVIPSEDQASDSIIEQLEIAIQILINQGYTFIVYCYDETQHDFCKKFVEVFKNEAIIYVKQNKKGKREFRNFIESGLSIVMSDQFLFIALLCGKPFVALQMNEEISNKLVSINENFFINSNELNAGSIVGKIKNISVSYEVREKQISLIFEERESLYENTNNKTRINGETDITVDLPDQMIGKNDDFRLWQQKIIENIQTLIEQGLLIEAKEIVNEYEKINTDDIEIFAIKGVITMMEGNLDESESLFKQGLDIDANHFDLNFNMGYLYSLKEEKDTARSYYEKAQCNAKTKSELNEVTIIIREL